MTRCVSTEYNDNGDGDIPACTLTPSVELSDSIIFEIMISRCGSMSVPSTQDNEANMPYLDGIMSDNSIHTQYDG